MSFGAERRISIISQLEPAHDHTLRCFATLNMTGSMFVTYVSKRLCPTTTLLHSENPTAPHARRHHGWVAQLAEQWTENPRVGGSIPPPASFRQGRIGYNCCHSMKYD